MSDDNNTNNPPGCEENDRPGSSASRSASSTSQQDRIANSPARPGTPASRSGSSPSRLNENSPPAEQDRTANTLAQPTPLYGWPRDPILDISSRRLSSPPREFSTTAVLTALERGRTMGPPFSTPFLGGTRTPQQIFEDELDASVFSNLPVANLLEPEVQITSNVRNESPRGSAVSPFVFPQEPEPERPRSRNQTVPRGDDHYYGPGLGRRNVGGRSIGASGTTGGASVDATNSSPRSLPALPLQAPIASAPSFAVRDLAYIAGPTPGAREYRARNPLDFPNFPGPTPPTIFERGLPPNIDQWAIEQDRLRAEASAATAARIHARLGLPAETQSSQFQFQNRNQRHHGPITPAPSTAPSIFDSENYQGPYHPIDIRRTALPGQILRRRLPQPTPAPEFGDEQLRDLINDPIFGPFPDADSVQLPPIDDGPRPDWGGYSPAQSSSNPRASHAVLETQRIAGLLEKYSFENSKAIVERLYATVVAKHTEYLAHHAMLQDQLATQSLPTTTDSTADSIADIPSISVNFQTDQTTDPAIDLVATTERLASEYRAGKAYLKKLPAAMVELKELIRIMQKLHLQKLHPHHTLYADAVRTGSGVPPVYQFERLLACGQTEAYARFPVRPTWMLEGPCLRMLRVEVRSPRKFIVFV